MIGRFFEPNPNVQRVIHYTGRRPFRAIFIFIVGILLGGGLAAENAKDACRQALAPPAAVGTLR